MNSVVDIVKIYKIKQKSTGYKRFIAKDFLTSLYGKFVNDLTEDKDYIERNNIMKTDLELKNFYNIEFGKTYKIINSHVVDMFELIGKAFHLERRVSNRHGNLVCQVNDGGRFDLSTLDDYDYIEIDTNTMLTPKEKEYLSSIIKPFKDRVVSICKFSNMVRISEAIMIEVKQDKALSTYYSTEPIFLPYFKAGTMYKNLVKDFKYTPKELGL